MARGITRAQIVDAALAVLDDGGIDAVTVRAVADRLGVKAPALYWHVRNKQALLDEMGTEIHRRAQAALDPDPGDDWRTGLTRYASALRTEYLSHRDGARTFSGTRLTDPEVLRAQEPWLESWSARGADLGPLLDAAEIVTAFVVGFVIEEQERAADPTRYDLAERDAAVGDAAPLVLAAGHTRDGGGTRFERQLAIVMAGVGTVLP